MFIFLPFCAVYNYVPYSDQRVRELYSQNIQPAQLPPSPKK